MKKLLKNWEKKKKMYFLECVFVNPKVLFLCQSIHVCIKHQEALKRAKPFKWMIWKKRLEGEKIPPFDSCAFSEKEY